MLRIPFDEMFSQFNRILLKEGFEPGRAALCARLFAEASRDGVYSHGLNRFPRFIEYIRKGYIKIDAIPSMISSLGVVERWDGNLGPGNLNAHFCMNRAVEIASKHGMGCVALANTNHWMRAGSYGWQAAEAGCIGICWTNTMPNMPPWGSSQRKVGNNPIVFSVPRSGGHIVLDIAMSQFSYGKMESYKLQGKQMPVDAGYDEAGNLTRDPAAVMNSGRPLPIGFWKGSGLSMLLDIIAAVLSGGDTTCRIGGRSDEYGLSQVFIAIDPSQITAGQMQQIINGVLDDLHSAAPAAEGEKVYYPGERTLLTREDNMKNGIPAEESIWSTVIKM